MEPGGSVPHPQELSPIIPVLSHKSNSYFFVFEPIKNNSNIVPHLCLGFFSCNVWRIYRIKHSDSLKK